MLKTIHDHFKKEMKEKFFKEKSYEKQKKELYDKLRNLNIKGLFSEKTNKLKPPFSIRKRIKRLKSSNIMNYYKTYYRLASIEAHSTPGSLGKYFNFDSKRNLLEINCGPKTEECIIAEILFT